MNKLIILRGPSGSGKSTVSRALIEKTKDKVTLFEEDYFRRTIFQKQEHTRELIAKMICHNTMIALNAGYDVIIEGIFNAKYYQKPFERLLEQHKGQNFIFYFDISLEETLKRHKTKPIAEEVTESDLKAWYPNSISKLGHASETIIPETLSLEDTVKLIAKKTKLGS